MKQLNEEYVGIANNILNQLQRKTDLIGAELGVRQGDLSETFLTINDSITMYSVDYWGSHDKISEFHDHVVNYEITKTKLEPFEQRSIIKNKLTSDAVLDFVDNFFDFVYIDATHTYEAVCEDIQNWAKKIKMDGVICGHDYCEGWPGVMTAVQKNVTDMSKLKLFPCNVWAIDVIYIRNK